LHKLRISNASSIEQLFVDICLYCNPTNALHLFETNLPHLMEDYVRTGHEDEIAKNLMLKWIQDKLQLNNQSMEDHSLPVPDFQLINRFIEAQIATDNGGDMQEKWLLGQRMLAQLNEGQRTAFNEIMASVEDVNNLHPRLFFLDGPGGTGKMFLYNTLIAVLQGQGKSVVAVASTGIAATLLTDGTTYLSKYKLYPPITETTRSKIEENSYSARVIREASLHISDEATMKDYALDGINHLYQMVAKDRNQPFGYKVLLLGGDFRQCLPVVRHGDRVQVVESTIKKT
jgi:PIF1-like helicase